MLRWDEYVCNAVSELRQVARIGRMSRLAKNRYYALLGVCSILLLGDAWGESLQVISPSGDVSLNLHVDESGALIYAVDAFEQPVIGSSRLGLELAERSHFDLGWRLHSASHRNNDSIWQQPWGERRHVRDNYRELLALFENAAGDRLALWLRAYDDGVAFRYEIALTEGAATVSGVRVHAELTEFRIDPTATVWWQPGDQAIRYEHLYRQSAIGEMANAHSPLTIRFTNGIHAAVHEAALVDYSAFTLQPVSPGLLVTRLRPGPDGVAVRTGSRFETPWRAVILSETAAGLLNSNLILNLNEPNKLGDVSWVRPGKYAGIWWAMHLGTSTWHAGPRHGATTDNALAMIDFAAASGLDGVLIEGWNEGWGDEAFDYTQAYPDFDMRSVSEYAREKGVYLIGHHETYGDVAAYERQLDAALDYYQTHAVPHIKTGYVAHAGELQIELSSGKAAQVWHDGQHAIDHQLRVVREAAKRRISINTHEPVKDTGLRRTYPNWMTREGSRGQEFAIWGETPNPPEHTVLLAYTRMLAGPMDFTPGMFNLHPKGADSSQRIQTTLAKQLALYVVLYSPMQMVPDLPENYGKRPDAFRFVVDVPTDWEQSVAIDGAVGDYVVMTRKERGGEDWYLGAITDEVARQLHVALDFLQPQTSYIAEIYADASDAHWASNPYAMVIEKRRVQRDDTLELSLAAGGGTAIRFRPHQEARQK